MGKISETFGHINQISVKDDCVRYNSGNAYGQLTYYRSSVLNVVLSKDEINNKHSYAVISSPENVHTSYTKDDQVLKFNSDKLKVELNIENGKIAIFDLQDKLISKDGLAVRWLGTEVVVSKELLEGEKFVGLGEKTGPLNRRGNAYVNWNTDKFGYAIDQDPLYLSTPFYIGIHNGMFYGVFVDNSYKTVFNFGASTERFSWFSAEDGEMNYYFIHGDTVAEVIQHYTWLTGRMKMPPLWSLGFQQCRYSYYPDDEIYQLAQTFRAKQIPCDVLYLDIHYMDAYKSFTFDKERFPFPMQMISDIRKSGFKTAVILDPGIKVEDGYGPYDSGIKKDVFLKYPDGENYIGEVWSGRSHFPDFTSNNAREWWKNLLPFYSDLGVKGFWNDMNEPAVWGQCIPNFIEFDFDGDKTTHREARNVYGMQMARATAEGLIENQPGERPFVLTRAGFSGIQRFSAVWTGDNISSDEHLLAGVRLVNSLGLTGVSFCGNDAGGFAGDASPELYARWITIAAFQPFFRAHTVVNSRDAEPWCFGELVEQIARNYIGLRYKLMPLIYSLFRESAVTGIPVNRSLVFDFPLDENTYQEKFQNQFFLGNHLMICPLESTKEFVKVWLPKGNWFCFWTGELFEGNKEIIFEAPLWKLPVFVKAGAIIPTQKLCQNLDKKSDELTLHVYAKANGYIQFYEDDGITHDYERGVYSLRKIMYSDGCLHFSKSIGDYQSSIRVIKIVFHGINPANVTLNGIDCKVYTMNNRFVEPIESIDIFSTQNGQEMKEEDLSCLEFEYVADEIKLRW